MKTGKIALVTASSRGLGRNMALHLARDGHDVIVTYRTRADEAADVKPQIEALGARAAMLPLDVADLASFQAFAGRLGEVLRKEWNRNSIDFLINNGGTNGQGKLGETQESVFDVLANVHFKGVYFLTQQLLPMIAEEAPSFAYRRG